MGEVICTSCGWRGPKPTYGGGRIALVIFLGFFFILPGILYALYVESLMRRCPNCGQSAIIPTDSPRARQLGSDPAAHSAATIPRSKTGCGAVMLATVIVIGLLAGVISVAAYLSKSPEQPTSRPRPVTAVEPRASVPAPPATELTAEEPARQATIDTAEAARREEREAAARLARDTSEAKAREERSAMIAYRLDVGAMTYHASDCPDARGLPRASLAAARLGNYRAHSCVKASGSDLR